MTGCPGYVGRVMCVVWDGGPDTTEVFTWNMVSGVMEREEMTTAGVWEAHHAMRKALEAAESCIETPGDLQPHEIGHVLEDIRVALEKAKAITGS